MKRKGRMQSVATLLDTMVREKKWGTRLRLHALFDFWEEVVGSAIAAHARPIKIHGMVLWVGVTDSVWMQQLHLQKILLLERLNARLQPLALADIRFELARVGAGKSLPPSSAPRAPKTVATALDRQKISRLTSGIGDDGIRRALDLLLQGFAALNRKKDS